MGVVWSVWLWAGASHSLERTLTLHGDTGAFALFHPDDLAHHGGEPQRWPWLAFSVQPDLEAGRLVCFESTLEGPVRFRVTQGGLTAREKRWKHGAWTFRLEVTHGRVLLDGAERLPHGERPEPLPPDEDPRWLPIPNGRYRVTVQSVLWTKEPGALTPDGTPSERALPAFVIRLEPVEDFGKVPVRGTMPRFGFTTAPPTAQVPSAASGSRFDEWRASMPTRAQRVAVLVEPELPVVPAFDATWTLAPDVASALLSDVPGKGIKPRYVVVVPSMTRARVGVLASVGTVPGASGGEPGRVNFNADSLVLLKDLQQEGTRLLATVEPFERPRSPVPPEELTALRAAFARYAAASADYRRRPFSSFEAQAFQEMDSPEGMSHFLLHQVAMPSTTRWELLRLPNAERLRRMRALLATEGAVEQGVARGTEP